VNLTEGAGIQMTRERQSEVDITLQTTREDGPNAECLQHPSVDHGFIYRSRKAFTVVTIALLKI
jgi:hypothetical protein